MWKRYASYQGGTADPMIVSWPARIKGAGIRTQYTHAVDIAPTIYELLGVELPEVVNGYTQHPLEGESFAASLQDADAKGKATQFYSMLGTRGIYHDGWKAASVTPAAPNAWGDFDNQRWELFDVENDPSECHDLAERAAREAEGARRAVVVRGEGVRRLATRVARCDRHPARTTAAALEAA